MTQEIKLPLLRSIGRIYNDAEGCGLNSELMEKLKDDLQITADYFGVNTIQALLLAHVFALNMEDHGVTFKRLSEYLKCNLMTLLEYNEDLNHLVERGMLYKQEGRRSSRTMSSNYRFFMNEKITNALLHNLPLPELKVSKFQCFMELLEEIENLSDELDSNEISLSLFDGSISEIIALNSEFPLIRILRENKIDRVDSFLYLSLIWDVLKGHENFVINNKVDHLFGGKNGRVLRYVQSFVNNSNKLVSMGWVQMTRGGFLNDAVLKLTVSSYNLLSDMGIELKVEKPRKDNVIMPENIGAKELFFNDRETRELAMLNKMMAESKLSRLRKRLKNKNLPVGITVLLHGQPGTGKTETVLQMARKTGREIYKVDISQTKSKWFGESEKIIKEIFSDYQSYAKKCPLMPILLFNEADGILSKRRDTADSNVAQTENAIQNIILDELENFEGIFVATTNLVNNLDQAFERRFLFKIEFDKPHNTVKARIWNSKLPLLAKKECVSLAAEFDFSGGQIDNIVRKCETFNVVYGKKITMQSIREFCQSEKLEKNARIKIGFQ